VTAYCDTSSLVKLYVAEPDSDEISELVQRASVVATSVVAYAEARAAFARRRRERHLSAAGHARILAQLDADWSAWLTVDVTEPLARAAGHLAARFGLRGFDAIHLASFETILSRADDEEVRFSSADRRLTRAAAKLA
jgi:predicted nucleic acid-binding protein